MNGHESFSLNLAPHRGLGKESHPSADLNGLLDGLNVVKLDGGVDAHAMLAKEAVDLFADDEMLVETDIRLAREIDGAHQPRRCQRMGRRADQRHLLLAPRHDFEFARSSRKGYQSHVDRPVQ